MGEDEGLAVMMAPEIWIKTGGVSVNENLDHPGNKNTPPHPKKKRPWDPGGLLAGGAALRREGRSGRGRNEGARRMPVPGCDPPMPYSLTAICLRCVMSRRGGAPNIRPYSRLNWEGLS